MNKLVITRLSGGVLTALVDDGKVSELQLEPEDGAVNLQSIYVGRVKNIVSNINSAFVEFEEGKIGYYSLTENRHHLYTKPHSDGPLREGDEIIVQISREAVKTKAPVLTSFLNFTGKYCVLTAGKNTIGFSAKICDAGWKDQLKKKLRLSKDDDFGIIVRTNALEASEDQILAELEHFKSVYRKLMREAIFRNCYACMYRAIPSYAASIRDSRAALLGEIVTDDEDIYREMNQYLASNQEEDAKKLVFYQDSLLPLSKLYSLETAVDEAIRKKIWLKSGGYLVIEPTEALVVVDVNTGKYSGKKNIRDTIVKINLEAAVEIARQLRLRNLSGIIIIDFIDMEREEDRQTLLRRLEDAVSQDPVKTTVVGITRLNLVEVTRKKIRKPFYEQVFSS